MIYKYNKLSKIQKIALYFYRTIDNTGVYYEMLLQFSQKSRIFLSILFYVIYVALVEGLFVFLDIVSVVENYKVVLYYFLISLLVPTSFYMLFPFFYVSLYNKVDIGAVLESYEKYKQNIAFLKKEFWRLRNMHFLVRIFIYLGLFVFLCGVALLQASVVYQIEQSSDSAQYFLFVSVVVVPLLLIFSFLYLEIKLRKLLNL